MQIRHYKSLQLVPVMNKMSQSHPPAYYSILISTVPVHYCILYKQTHRLTFDIHKVRLLCLPFVSVACYMPLSFYPPVLFTIYLEMFYSLMINTFLRALYFLTF